ncbi:MAG: hypothetical protein KKA62_05870 [Nanoarchaeota archaeon]|nr:hypothetical protein [Nanoarchaeota archaeon]MBU1643859.1 hypothetical protein [Nanoarchaeota archaeon]MBU1977451.1 hypothetical protein [Nanoarchaeota archaeon]
MEYTLDDIYESAGEELTDKMLAVVGKENILEWFYKPNKVFKGKSPDDLCKEGDYSTLNTVIMDILTAAHGG